MISGFVIYFTIERSRNWRDFAFSRFTRLYPVYWLTLTLMVVMEAVVFQNQLQPASPPNPRIWWGGYVVNLTMLQEFVGFNNYDSLYWSLTVEIAFYIDMAALFVLGWLGRMEVVAAVWLAIACLAAFVTDHLGLELPNFPMRLAALEYAPFFMGGIMFYLLRSKGVTPARLAVIASALVAEWWIHGAARLGIASILYVIFALAAAGKLRFIVSPVTMWLGTISYSLYLVHHNLGYSALLRLHENGVAIPVMLVVTGAGALVLASLASYLVERPSMRLARQWYERRRVSVVR